MDKELSCRTSSRLYESVSTFRISDDGIMENGAIILSRTGKASVSVNYKLWALPQGAVMTLFPGDVISIGNKTSDFSADILTYSPAILREASLDLEHTVYDALRQDRCRGDSKVVSEIVSRMFGLLNTYFKQPECGCLNQLVILQLKAFFVGFHDYLLRFPELAPALRGSKRKRSLFNDFMQILERDYHKCRDVSYYAEALHITSKYLNVVSRQIAGRTAKTVIDHYVILKLKIDLSRNACPIKQLAWDYNFSDASFFTRYFRQHTGMTPLSYRRKSIDPSESPRDQSSSLPAPTGNLALPPAQDARSRRA